MNKDTNREMMRQNIAITRQLLFHWLEGPTYSLCCTRNLNINDLSRNSSGQQGVNRNGHIKPDGTFSGFQISDNQHHLAVHLRQAPALLIFSLKDVEQKVRSKAGKTAGDRAVMEAEDAGDCNRR